MSIRKFLNLPQKQSVKDILEEANGLREEGKIRGDLPRGIGHIFRLVDRERRLKRRGKRPRKPTPRNRAALVARQKKARPRVWKGGRDVG